MNGHHHREKGIGIVFSDLYLVGGVRTPFGKYCGTLARISPTDLGIVVAKAAMERTEVKAGEVDQLIAANIGQSSLDAYFLPRHIALYSGLPVPVPALMVQRICGSGFETIITGAEQIMLGKADVALCVGTENMSLAPTVSFGGRMGYPLGKPDFRDMLWEALDDTAAGYPMGFTAENVARKFGISRDACDCFAESSFERAGKAASDGKLAKEIVSVGNAQFDAEGLLPRMLRLPKGCSSLNKDEHLRPTSLEVLSALPAVFDKVGVLTAGNCSGIVDGAAAVLVASGEFLHRKSKRPIVRIVAATSSGIDPRFMGLGPVPAIRYLLEITGLRSEEIGLFEINEAFSAQVLGCIKELELNPETVNVNGGAIALGHPLAATGLRLSLAISNEMIRRKIRFGIASACIGGGQGTALLFENPNP